MLGDLTIVLLSLVTAPIVAALDICAAILLKIYGFHYLICWSPSILSIAIPFFVLAYLVDGRCKRFIEGHSSGCSEESREQAMAWIVAKFSKRKQQ